jgi:hypothetical protein
MRPGCSSKAPFRFASTLHQRSNPVKSLLKALCLVLLSSAASLALAGCGDHSAPAPRAADKTGDDAAEAKVQAALAKLPAEDRKLAEEQKFCAVLNDNRLGSMGTPVKVLVKGEPVFLCCEGCEKKALADPDKTLAKVGELKEKAAGSPRP